MKNKQKQNFYLYYLLKNSEYCFLYAVRDCKAPQQTKQYKKLKNWLNMSIVQSIGYCTNEYFEDYKKDFISPNLTYLQIN
jgi:hypothetical protein